jgi:hypothetical protein
VYAQVYTLGLRLGYARVNSQIKNLFALPPLFQNKNEMKESEESELVDYT